MKIYTKVTISMDTGEVLDSESYEHDGPIAACKGGSSKTTYVQSPQAQEALSAYMPALYRMGQQGAYGAPLWNTGNIPTSSLGDYPVSGYEAPSAAGLMPSAANIGAIDPNIKEAVAAPYLEAIGQVTEQFGGGMGSARAGLSGAGANVLNKSMQTMIPQYTQSLWNMVQPGLMTEYQANVGGTEAGWQAQLARAGAATSLAAQQYQAEQAARAAPYQALPGIVGGAMPSPVTSGGGKK